MRTATVSQPMTRIRGLLAAVTAALLVAAMTPGSTWTASSAGAATENIGGGAAVVVDRAVDAAARSAGAVEVIVRAYPERVREAHHAVTRAGGEVLRPLPIVDGFSARLTTGAIEQLRRSGSDLIRVITLDGQVRFNHDAPEGEAYNDSSFVETIGAHRLHRKGVDGAGVGIAIIDTGVSEVADLRSRIVGGVDVTADGDGVDRYGHGTFVAGVAAGSGVSSDGEHAGVAPGAHIVPVKIASANGAADVSHVLAAIQWVVSFKDDYDIEILNMSFGTDSTQSYTLDPLNYAVEKAWDEGIVVVVAAANDGPEAGTVFKPADDPMVITVGATDSNGTVKRGDDIVADFSSRGPTRADGLEKPDLVAPGAHTIGLRSPGSTIDSSYPQARVGDHYFRGSGTSFATAVTSGAVALLKQLYPGWTPDDVKGALFKLAADGPVGDPNVDGKGALDVRWADQIDNTGLSQAGITRSTGSGTMDASRGNLVIEIEKDPVAGLLDVLDGDYTAQDQLFDFLEYTTTDWSAANWYESQWTAANWYAANWYAANWYAANWYAANWY